jgi:hypothetical protein
MPEEEQEVSEGVQVVAEDPVDLVGAVSMKLDEEEGLEDLRVEEVDDPRPLRHWP